MWPFCLKLLWFPILRERTPKAPARPFGCTGSLEPSLFAYVISTPFTRAGSLIVLIITVIAIGYDFYCDIS